MIFDKPDSVELLDAVNHFLNEKIKDEVPPHLAFKLRIVENVLNIVGREIALGEKLSYEVIKDLRELIETDTANIKDLAYLICLLYTSPSPRDLSTSRMPSYA